MTDLTDRQKLVPRTIEAHIRKHGWAPTHRELSATLGSRWPATKVELRSDGRIPIVLGTARGPVRGVFWTIPGRNEGASGEDRGGPVDIATGDRHAGP